MHTAGRRGQLTIFIMLGILIVFLFLISYYTNRRGIEATPAKSTTTTAQSQEVEEYVTSCLREVSESAILLIGRQGGSTTLAAEHLKTQEHETNYLYYYGQNRVPTNESIEQDIAAAVAADIPKCVARADFPNRRMSFGEPTATARLLEQGVRINLSWPLTVAIDSEEFTFSDFAIEVPVRLGTVRTVVYTIVESMIQNVGSFDGGPAQQQGMTISYSVVDLTDAVFALTDPSSRISDKPYLFIFGAKGVVQE